MHYDSILLHRSFLQKSKKGVQRKKKAGGVKERCANRLNKTENIMRPKNLKTVIFLTGPYKHIKALQQMVIKRIRRIHIRKSYILTYTTEIDGFVQVVKVPGSISTTATAHF